ncbi:MAG: ferrous iron transport protein A [Candidatus Omnitrophota bacterium]|nr:MAG: ferrous iron transport protein A [Candidatus Omnitrophota bacterium]
METILINLRPGEWGKVVAIGGGHGIRQKLSLRDIQEGSKIRMISSYPGPVIIEVNRNMVALGRGMAGNIMVQKLRR